MKAVLCDQDFDIAFSMQINFFLVQVPFKVYFKYKHILCNTKNLKTMFTLLIVFLLKEVMLAAS